jgi:diadenosine tetraphosphate (Ap4A) HIT family hydrolase
MSNETTVNATIRKFGWPASLVREFTHWLVLVRPAQPTLGSLVLAAKSEATAFGELPGEAHAELKLVISTIETALAALVCFKRINYLMLMMVDPYVHFHVIPRYEGVRTLGDLTLPDHGWPGIPVLSDALVLAPEQLARLVDVLQKQFSSSSPP